MTEGITTEEYALAVDRTEFVKALKDIAQFKRRGGGFVRFSYADGELAIAMPNVTIRVAAQGTWPTEVTMTGGWIRSLARVPPEHNPVLVTYDGARVTIGTTVIPASARGVGCPGTSPRRVAPREGMGPIVLPQAAPDTFDALLSDVAAEREAVLREANEAFSQGDLRAAGALGSRAKEIARLLTRLSTLHREWKRLLSRPAELP